MTNYDRGREDGLYAGLLSGVVLGCVALAIVVIFIALSARDDTLARGPIEEQYEVLPPVPAPPVVAPDVYLQPGIPRAPDRPTVTPDPSATAPTDGHVPAAPPDTREPVDDGTESATDNR